MDHEEHVQRVAELTVKIGMMLNGEKAAVCLTTLCFLMAVGLSQLDPAADEEGLQALVKQVAGNLNRIRANEEGPGDLIQLH